MDIEPNKPILDLSAGIFYAQNQDGTMQKIFDGELKTVEFEPEPLDIMNLMPKNVFWNIKPMTMSMTAKFKPSFTNDNIMIGKPVEPWEMRKYDQIQKRKHHKTRISKKWAKRYGYWNVEDIYKLKSLTPQDLDKEVVTYNGEIEFKERRVY